MKNVKRHILLLIALSGLLITTTHAQDHTMRRVRVPILMYHYVGELPADADEYRINLTVSTELFRNHLTYLRDSGYTAISFADLEAALVEGEALPENPVILTFDDGHLDHFSNAFPLLKEFDMTGTFFVITSRVDASDPAYISWEQAKEMSDAGMTIAAHTKNHPDLRNRDQDYLTYEIIGSIESIEAHIGTVPHAFAYPGGRYDDAVLNVLDDTPIDRAVTTEFGSLHTTDNALLLPRLRVSNDTSVSGLAYLLQAGAS